MIQINVGKVLSLLIAVGYVVSMVVQAHGFSVDVLKGCVALLLPLALIWLPEQIGNATGYLIGNVMRVDTPTPPILISMMGWFFLIGIPLLLFFLS